MKYLIAECIYLHSDVLSLLAAAAMRLLLSAQNRTRMEVDFDAT